VERRDERVCMSAHKLSLQNVGKRFASRSKTTTVLQGITLDVADEEFVSVVGVSGCGKSTLLAIIAGLENFDAGQVLIDGVGIEGPGRDRGVVFQSHTLLPWLTAQQNVEFALRAGGMRRAEAGRVARDHLERVKLGPFADHYPSQLSGGMKQRVAIARTLSYKPEVMLMDEPFGALDAFTRVRMQELLTQIWEDHKLTVMLVTHDVEEAVFLSDRVFVMGSNPGTIKSTFVIDLPRPRSRELTRSARFASLHADILDSIHDDLTS
jgi:NitT/TauT family transport system ATP-binding protein